MDALAEALGYAPRTMLLTKDATVNNVVSAIGTASETLTAGDTLFLTYSGHGGQVPDSGGDEGEQGTNEFGERTDGQDETWVLFDRQLIDDELYELWRSFAPDVRIIVLSDSCHSGTATREPPPWAGEGSAPNRRLPTDVPSRVYEANKTTYDGVLDADPLSGGKAAPGERRAHLGLHGRSDERRWPQERSIHRSACSRCGRTASSTARSSPAAQGGHRRDARYQTPNYYVVGAKARASPRVLRFASSSHSAYAGTR